MAYAEPHTVQNVIGEVTVEPGCTTEFMVGIYESQLPRPELKLEVTPKKEETLATTLVINEGFGDYTLTYYFTNVSKAPAHVKVFSQWTDEKVAA